MGVFDIFFTTSSWGQNALRKPTCLSSGRSFSLRDISRNSAVNSCVWGQARLHLSLPTLQDLLYRPLLCFALRYLEFKAAPLRFS